MPELVLLDVDRPDMSGLDVCRQVKSTAATDATIVVYLTTASSAAETVRGLVVEDNDDAREALRTVLELDGHEVAVAPDGAAGLAAALSFRPDVALIDIGLPGLDGYEVCRRLRATPGGTSICVIALTGYGQPEDHAATAAAGFDAHLVKPVEPAVLERAIGALLSGNMAP